MKSIVCGAAAIVMLGVGMNAAQACPDVVSTLTSPSVAQPRDVTTDISSAKTKKKMRKVKKVREQPLWSVKGAGSSPLGTQHDGGPKP